MFADVVARSRRAREARRPSSDCRHLRYFELNRRRRRRARCARRRRRARASEGDDGDEGDARARDGRRRARVRRRGVRVRRPGGGRALIGAAHDRDAFADGVPEGDGGFNDGFVASLGMVLVSELGDETFIIAAIMAMRTRGGARGRFER